MSGLITFVEIAAARGIALLCERADALGAHVSRQGEVAVIEAVSGIITATPASENDREGVQLSVSAEAEDSLQMLCAAIDAFIAQSGLQAPVWRAAPAPVTPEAGNSPPKSRLMEARLLAKTRLSPSYFRLRLAGDFAVFNKGGLHFRLLLGPDDSAWPEPGADGITWPGGIDAWHRPPYTARAVAPGGEWIDFDVFVHEGGRVTEWCEAVQPGARVMLTGPGGRGVKQAGWMGILGDETALPVVLRAIEAAGPEARGEAMILIPDERDIQPVTPPPGLRLQWILRCEGLGLTDLLTRLTPPPTDRFIFFAGERSEAEAARAWAKAAGLSNGEFHAASYWTAGWVPPVTQRQAKGIAVTAEADAG